MQPNDLPAIVLEFRIISKSFAKAGRVFLSPQQKCGQHYEKAN
jgi:hypothetical protein